MSINYPSGSDNPTDPAGTSLETSPDHAGQHTDNNAFIRAAEAVLGTTAGTSVLKNFAAGQFPQRVTGGGATGTLVATSVGGTFSNSVVNNGTLGTPQITGGTITGTPSLDVNSIPGSAFTATAITLGYSPLTGTQGAITTTTALTGGTVTVTVPSGNRLLELTGFIPFFSNNAGSTSGTLLLTEGSGTLNSSFVRLIEVGGVNQGLVSWIGTPSAASHTYVLSIAPSAGTITVTNIASNRFGYLLAKLI